MIARILVRRDFQRRTSMSPQCMLALVAVLVAGCTRGGLAGEDAVSLTPQQVISVFGSAAALDVVRFPERVEAWRIESPKKPVAEVSYLDRWARLSKPVPLARNVVQQLVGILERPTTYSFDRAKGCEFDPGVQIHFVKGNQVVDVLLCFKCKELNVCHDGKRVGGEDFDNEEPALLALTKQIFPGDTAILELEAGSD
jgi:hypothetical protein